MDSFDDTLALVAFYIRVSGYKSRTRKHIFLVHVRDEWEGGLSDVERRALMQMCFMCGGSAVRMSDHPSELTPPQVLEIARTKAPAT